MKNIKFNYLYRDASNYKTFNSIIFPNPQNIPLQELEEKIIQNLIDHQYFIASKINIPEIFLNNEYDFNKDDHGWHEFEDIETTEEEPNDEFERSISDFIEGLRNERKI